MQKSKKLILLISDLVAVFASFFISLRIGYWREFNPEVYQTHIGPFIIIYSIWIIMIFAFGLYEPGNQRPTIKSIRNFVVSIIVSLAISITFFYVFNIFGISPKTNLLINISVFTLLFIFGRRLVTSLLSKRFTEKVLLLGEDHEFSELEERIISQKGGYYTIMQKSESLTEDIIEKIKNSFFDLVIFSPKKLTNESVEKNLETFMQSGVTFLNIAKAYEKIIGKIPHDQVDEIWFVTNVQNNKNNFYESTKRMAEIFFATFGLIILSPIFLLGCILIKIQDGGPIFIKQKRIGKHNKAFKLLKLRSMVVLNKDGSAESEGYVKWAEENDPRITPTGRILRKTHIDEMPQLINVIRGDMSFVGPRPERPEFIKDLVQNINNYNLRHIVKPGITGWAQINYKYGNSMDDSRQKFEYDLYYVKNRNLFMDVGILVRTVQKIIN